MPEYGRRCQPFSDPQLRYMRQVALAKLLLIDVVIDIYGLAAGVSSKLLDEIPRHSRPEQVSHEPVAAAMRREPIFQPAGLGIVKAYPLCVLPGELLYAPFGHPGSGP